MKITSRVRNHFNNLAIQCEFGNNHMLLDILTSLIDIFKVFIWYVHVREDEAERVIIVEDVIKPYLYLLLVFFKGKQNITFVMKNRQQKLLRMLQISCVFLEWHRHKIFILSAELVSKMLNNHCQSERN